MSVHTNFYLSIFLIKKKVDEILNFKFQVSDEKLLDIIMAANYLDISGLLDKACKTVADKIKHFTPKEILRTFNIQEYSS